MRSSPRLQHALSSMQHQALSMVSFSFRVSWVFLRLSAVVCEKAASNAMIAATAEFNCLSTVRGGLQASVMARTFCCEPLDLQFVRERLRRFETRNLLLEDRSLLLPLRDLLLELVEAGVDSLVLDAQALQFFALALDFGVERGAFGREVRVVLASDVVRREELVALLHDKVH